ncbi:PREDICTED: serine/threonine-protein kinase PLK4-like isoform X2 [Cyprinodon variegatus]|uniref:serine/threonine-protein kinase PLK4-like isoform X2 n=1 Tax=Cyprinodon variegatus TaxID=28743 RepID=UPI0007426B75|nr:PREDICTED: serine/threonine-protein kinase PLK4-like isoform X2 [Cyprinodon variegatus]
MGGAQSKLKQEGYVEKQKTENYIVATKEDNTVLIKMVPLPQQCRQSMAALTSEIKTLQEMKHPHLVNINNSFEDENQNIYYVVMEDCQGGNLADKIIEMPEPPEESEILSYIVEICMALKVIHEACLLHKDLMPKNVLFTEFGLVCLGGFGNIHENSKNLSSEPTINYLAPEVFTDGTYDPKSDMWSVGCILYELCTKQRACKTTVEELQTKLDTLRALADGLERIHEGTTIASLTGGVIGAVGGITSIVGLILSPFTLGASLIVTGIGVGVGAVGGVTAGASNITNMVNQSSDRKTVHSIIKELEQKISAVVSWLVEISYSFQAISSIYADVCDDDGNFSNENIKKIGLRAGRNLSGITELIRLVRVVNIGKIAAQTSRAVRVAEVATGILSGLFVAVDIFFIAMDAKEIHDIKQARVAETSAASPQSADEMDNSAQTSDETMLINSSLMQESDPAENNQTMDQATPKKAEIRSEVMKFVKSVREAAENMEKVLAELKTVIQSIPSFLEHNEMEWQNMELM